MSSRRCHLLLLNLCAAALPATALRSGSSGPGTSNAPPIASTPIIPITGDDWTFIGGEWLSASPSPYAYSGGAGGENIKGSWNAPAAKSIAGDTNEFGVHPVQDDVHLAVYTVKPFKDFSASFDLTHTAQLASGFFMLRAKDAAHYYMIEIPESGIATRDGFEGIYVSRVGDDTGGRWARGLFVEQLHGVSSECCGVWKTLKISVVGSVLSIWVNNFPVPPLVLEGAGGEFAAGGYVGFGTTSGWYEGSCPLYIRNFRITGTAKTLTDTDSTALGAHSTQRNTGARAWNTSVKSTLGTAWWFPTPVINGTSIDFPPPGGAPGPAGLTHFPNGLIGYIGTFTKTGYPLPTDRNLWHGFILSKDLGQNWFKGPNILAAEVVGHPGQPGSAGKVSADASPWAGIKQIMEPDKIKQRRGGYSGLGFAGFERPDKTRGNEAGSPWLPDDIGILITPQIMWYDKVAKQTVGYWISPKPLDIKDGNGPEFRLIERTTKDGLHWSATAPVRRNISMLELAKTQCTGLSGSVTDNTTTLGRCVLGGKTSNSLAMPGFNLTVFESWRASFGANDNTFTVTPNGTIIIWLSFSNDFDIMQSNGRTYWTMPFGKDSGTGGTDQNGKPIPGADGPPWMMACLRSVDRGKTFELINTDSTLGLGRDKEATEHAGFTFMSDAAGRGAISAMAWTTEGELIATGVSNWDITSAWSYDDGKTWEPYTHGPFWAAANNAISTSSGVLIFGGRYPDIGIQISYEYVVDTSAFEANGCFLEIRPDEVLMGYGGSYSPKGNRFQLIKVDRERGAAWPIPITDGDRELGLAGLGPGGGPRADGRAPPSEVVRQTVTLTY